MITVAQARARILAGLKPVAAETVALSAAHGRVLAEDAVARRSQPGLAVSAMDGYAVRAADVASTPARLKVVMEIAAGARPSRPIGAGEAARIFTGAPVPDGADAIIMQENTTRDGAHVTVNEAARPGAFVRPEGLDFRAGQVLLAAGRRLTARDIGLLAAMNIAWVGVRRRPAIALLATGDEIKLPGEAARPQEVVSSGTYALDALIRTAGGAPHMLGVAEDSADSLAALAAGAAGMDALVTTGGASVGAHDLVREALGGTGLVLDFWKIAMRPGKPLIFGRLASLSPPVPMLGLPGNPVSSYVCGLLFLVPMIRRMLGAPEGIEEETATLGRALGANDEREEYLRAALARGAQGGLIATPFDAQDSAMFATLARAECLILRPPHAPPAPEGAAVTILRLAGGGPSF